MNNDQHLNVLITGADGFIGKNLVIRANELHNVNVLLFTRKDDIQKLKNLVKKSDVIIHLAGVNRSIDLEVFEKDNTTLSQKICELIKLSGKKIPLFFSSSSQADEDNPYGKSKLAAEHYLTRFSVETKNPVTICRLPGVFGKWSKPNYNSVVATFCYNIANDLPIKVHDKSSVLELAYIDDVIDDFLKIIFHFPEKLTWLKLNKTYQTTVGEVSEQIISFKSNRDNLISDRVGVGLTRALYSTYISFLLPEQFTYDLPIYRDDRGVFCEVLKTFDSGQFSFFTVNPGDTRGSHYHHTKTEKFVILKGVAKMRFKEIISQDTYELIVSDKKPQVVDTVPGWVHDITNISESELIVMIWANEVFNVNKPDTIQGEVL